MIDGLRNEKVPAWRSPTLATLTVRRFSDPGWIFERKLDGVRCLAFRDGGQLRLLSRNRLSLNNTYPEVIEALSKQDASQFVVDGEIVAFEGRRTSFARLGRLGITDPDEAHASGIAVFYYLFDLLHLDGKDTTALPLVWRKQLLRNAFQFTNPLRYTSHQVRDGEKAYRAACDRGDEGCDRQAGRRALRRPPVDELGEAQLQPRPGIRDRRLHLPQGQPRRTRCAATGLLRRC